jgi:hypothetical protein
MREPCPHELEQTVRRRHVDRWRVAAYELDERRVDLGMGRTLRGTIPTILARVVPTFTEGAP